MRILIFTPYVTINSRPEFSKNKTGFGYMVYDIAHAVGEMERVDLFATDSRGEAFDIDGAHFLKRSFGLFLKSIFRCLSPIVVWRLWRQYHMSNGSLVRLIYYWLISGYVKGLFKCGRYDIVHIHGCGFASELWMQVCKNCGQKYVVTLHGLNSFTGAVRLEPAAKQYERDFLKRVVGGEIPITVISTGMKRMIEKTFDKINCDNIFVVCNSFSFSNNASSGLSVREKYGIPSNAKVLLYVGNISENKNQLQMVKVFDLLSGELRNQTWVLFCGENHMGNNISFEEAIKNSPNADHLVLCGGIRKELMSAYYEEADAVVLLSQTEGFGLSLIEGMHFGLPGLMFTDMDAYEDIYDANAVIGVADRTNQCVVDGIEQLLKGRWNKEVIKSCSERFGCDMMAQRYILVYKRILA